MSTQTKKVIIVGGGFAGINAANRLANRDGVQVTILDKRNHHLFQPLLYQVATAALNPADIAVPIRSIYSRARNVKVFMQKVLSVDPVNKTLTTDFAQHSYDYLILAAGATHSYFGHNEWEVNAPGLKTLEEAEEIRSRILDAYEKAEMQSDIEIQRQLLTFVVVGGGPTGVEMAGALGEISRYTLSRDFSNIDPKRARVILIEGGPRILPAFDQDLSEIASRDLERLGVTIWTNSIVTDVRKDGVYIGKERINTTNVFWAAGVGSVEMNDSLGVQLDRQGRIPVEKDLSMKEYPDIFVVGDQAHFKDENGVPLPGIAPVAIQQGTMVPENILADIRGEGRKEFQYYDKGIMATVGRERAIVQTGKLKFTGFFAWILWLFVHLMYLVGFKNRFVVFTYWFWTYITFRRGSRLITSRSLPTRLKSLEERVKGSPKKATKKSVKKSVSKKSEQRSAKKKTKSV